ncbi:hypothetical protein CPB85DRAFT_1312257 [Mucidula mucida]|nr:hypothetical protein CPB85DRAFT_1312257 [Mucidula mucida]
MTLDQSPACVSVPTHECDQDLRRYNSVFRPIIGSCSLLWPCIINREYADPETCDQVFDIFSTQSLTSSHLIKY